MYCAAVLDAYSRRVVGWSIDNNMRSALVVDALGMAITRRRPEPHSAILHSDHGSQFTSWAFGKRLTDAGLVGSMARSAIATTIQWSSRSGARCNSNFSTHEHGELATSLPRQYSSG